LGQPVSESHATDPLCLAVEAAWNSGIVVVVAAGNLGRYNYSVQQGYGTIASPGNHPSVITVGATNTGRTSSTADGVVASYSSKRPTAVDQVLKPDLVAPGNLIASVRDGGHIFCSYPSNEVPFAAYMVPGLSQSGYRYYRMSGTSMAAPMVSGAAALLIAKEPSLTPDQVKARLMRTARKTFPSLWTWQDPASGNHERDHARHLHDRGGARGHRGLACR
jgi:serine protease AprX